MAKSETQMTFEKQVLTEAENEIRKNVEDLVRWLDGSLKYFVRSIKGLSELHEDKEIFRSYVTKRLLDNLGQLSEIADIYDTDDETPEDENEEKNFHLNEQEIDYKDLGRFYASEIVSILATNTDELDLMRFRISMLHFIAGSPDNFGNAVLDYVAHRVLMLQTKDMSQKIATLLCLVKVLRDREYEAYGEYADTIKEIVDDMTLTICMSITKDYESSKNPE
ncbi:MAG: hypothetical protein MJZ12_06480 [Prevotella sp.]|nr:hypothetical protein [Prevotella sp.]